jgi:hypothetical protein
MASHYITWVVSWAQPAKVRGVRSRTSGADHLPAHASVSRHMDGTAVS